VAGNWVAGNWVAGNWVAGIEGFDEIPVTAYSNA